MGNPVHATHHSLDRPARLFVILALAAITGAVVSAQESEPASPAEHSAPEDARPIGFDARFRGYGRLEPDRGVWHPLHQGNVPSPHERIERLLSHPLLANPAQ